MVGFFSQSCQFLFGVYILLGDDYIPKARFEKFSNLITLPEKKKHPMFSKAYNHYPPYKLGHVDDLEPS